MGEVESVAKYTVWTQVFRVCCLLYENWLDLRELQWKLHFVKELQLNFMQNYKLILCMTDSSFPGYQTSGHVSMGLS